MIIYIYIIELFLHHVPRQLQPNGILSHAGCKFEIWRSNYFKWVRFSSIGIKNVLMAKIPVVGLHWPVTSACAKSLTKSWYHLCVWKKQLKTLKVKFVTFQTYLNENKMTIHLFHLTFLRNFELQPAARISYEVTLSEYIRTNILICFLMELLRIVCINFNVVGN